MLDKLPVALIENASPLVQHNDTFLPCDWIPATLRISCCSLFMLAGWLGGCLGNYGDSIPQKVARDKSLLS